MNTANLEHRDRVLRAYFEGRNWDQNNEYALRRHLVLHSEALLPTYPFVVDDEWEVQPNRGQEGKGDLIFADGAGRYAIVEVKWLDLTSTGKPASNKRTRKRKKVKEQAQEYADCFAQLLQNFVQVEGYYFTNEHQTPQLIQNLAP